MSDQVYGPGSGGNCPHGVHPSVAVCQDCVIESLRAELTTQRDNALCAQLKMKREQDGLRQERDTARFELAEARKQIDYYKECREADDELRLHVEAERDTAIAYAKRMREALERYGKHQLGCQRNAKCWPHGMEHGCLDNPCTCGLDAALSATTEKKGEGKDG